MSKRARVLVDTVIDGIALKPNQVVEASAARIKAMGNAVDASPEAVQFCIDELGTEIVGLDAVQPSAGTDTGLEDSAATEQKQ